MDRLHDIFTRFEQEYHGIYSVNQINADELPNLHKDIISASVQSQEDEIEIKFTLTDGSIFYLNLERNGEGVFE